MPSRDAPRRFPSRPPGDWLLAFQALLLLGLSRAATLVVPFHRIVKRLELEGHPPTPPVLPYSPREFRESRAARVRWAVDAAARRTPWESACLTQALAGLILLRLRGVESTLYLGVATEGALRELKAHAWLTVGGRVLLGERGMAAFTPVSAFTRRSVTAEAA